MTANLGDTARCPLGVRCECCGIERRDLAVCTYDLGALGVACLTVCPACGANLTSPPITIGTAVTLVVQHAAHVGVAVGADVVRRRYKPVDRHTYRHRNGDPRIVPARTQGVGIVPPAAR